MNLITLYVIKGKLKKDPVEGPFNFNKLPNSQGSDTRKDL